MEPGTRSGGREGRAELGMKDLSDGGGKKERVKKKNSEGRRTTQWTVTQSGGARCMMGETGGERSRFVPPHPPNTRSKPDPEGSKASV